VLRELWGTMDVMGMLEYSGLDAMKREFMATEARGEEMTIALFVQTMLRYIRASGASKAARAELISALCELFNDIDVNGNGSVDWEEFTNFCVESGMSSARIPKKPLDFVFKERKDYNDHTSRGSFIKKMRWIPRLQRILVCEADAKAVKVYKHDCTLLAQITRAPKKGKYVQDADAGVFYDMCYLEKHNQLAISSSDMSILFYEPKFKKHIGFTDEFTLVDTLNYEKDFSNLKSPIRPSSQSSMCWSVTTDTLFTSGANVEGIICVWDVCPETAKKTLRTTIREHTNMVTDMVVVVEHAFMVSASLDHTIRLWDITSCRARGQLAQHKKGVRQLIYSQKNDLLLSVGFEFDCYAWALESKHLVMTLSGHRFPLVGVQLVQFSATEELAVTADIAGNFRLWEVQREAGQAVCKQWFKTQSTLSQFEPRMFVSVPPERNIVAAGSKLHIFNAAPVPRKDMVPVKALYAKVTQEFIMVYGSCIKVYDAHSGHLCKEFHAFMGSELTDCVLDGAHRKLVVGNKAGQVLVFNLMNMEVLTSAAPHDAAVHSVLCVTQDEVLISAGWDQQLRVHHDIEGKKATLIRFVERSHAEELTCSAMSYSASMIATAAADFSVRVWDYQSFKMEHECIAHASEVTAMAFVETLPLLLTADCMGNVLMWAVRPHPKAGTCLHAFQNFAPLQEEAEEEKEGGGEGTFITETKPNPRRRRTEVGISVMEAVYVPERENGDNGVDEDGGSTSNTIPAQCLLFTGDDHGDIKQWDLSATITRLCVCPIHASKRPCNHPMYNPHQTRHLDGGQAAASIGAGGQAKLFTARSQTSISGHPSVLLPDGILSGNSNNLLERKRSFVEKGGMPRGISNCMLPIDVEQVAAWSAHSDSVRSLQVIYHPPSILSASYDGSARVFTWAGDNCLGTICNSEDEVMHIAKGHWKEPAWLFEGDDSALKLEKKNEADAVNRELSRKKREARSGKRRDGGGQREAEKKGGKESRHHQRSRAKALKAAKRRSAREAAAERNEQETPRASYRRDLRTDALVQARPQTRKYASNVNDFEAMGGMDGQSEAPSLNFTDDHSVSATDHTMPMAIGAAMMRMKQTKARVNYQHFDVEENRKMANRSKAAMMNVDVDTSPSPFLKEHLFASAASASSRHAFLERMKMVPLQTILRTIPHEEVSLGQGRKQMKSLSQSVDTGVEGDGMQHSKQPRGKKSSVIGGSLPHSTRRSSRAEMQASVQSKSQPYLVSKINAIIAEASALDGTALDDSGVASGNQELEQGKRGDQPHAGKGAGQGPKRQTWMKGGRFSPVSGSRSKHKGVPSHNTR
jgi:WD40 repeat protein